MKIKLAEALLRRKELDAKVKVLTTIKNSTVYEAVVQRVKVTDGLDEVTARVPKLTLSQVTAEYDHHARALRLVDAAIQQANWTTEIEVGDIAMADYVAPELPKTAPAKPLS